MRCKLYNTIFRLVLLLYIGAIAYLCFADLQSLPDVQREIFGIPTDKIVHFAMFFPFPWITYSAFSRKPSTVGDIFVGVVSACAVGCVFAGVTEIIQGALEYRSEDVRDFAADCIAVCSCGVILLIAGIVGFYKDLHK